MKCIKQFCLVTSVLVANLACDNQKNTSEAAKTTTVAADTTKVETPKLTKIQFYETEHDFGKINEGEKVSHKFKFKNVGDAPLIIQRTNTSCGCTVPTHTKDPVPPGGEGEINVEYNSKDREGKIEKTVTVIANTEPQATELKIKVFVLKKIKGPYNN
ncbi:MAG: DUF1573 domain-containing protein [Cytophagaceae bacterium]|nr:DUF1573 domain-containing protein [Cytophagaceae bacterium]MDW8456423.1 DUF1573 domain-containing protein [Cytophagaceae bacterium]